jgi:hypothetical protein
MMIVERHEQGFFIWAPRYGMHAISADGARVRSAVPRVAAWRWERLLFAQVLPLAAALAGRELFHASAVSLDCGAVAFLGSSGAGKSSVAAQLVARGASLVTDDVLALAVDLRGTRILAYPGARLAGVDPRELATMTDEGRRRLGAMVGRSDKTYFATPVAESHLPLCALYYLDRGPGPRSIEISACRSLASRLLGSSFLSYLDSPEHLVGHLDVCARIAQAVPTYEVTAPTAAAACDVAAAVEAHSVSWTYGAP